MSQPLFSIEQRIEILKLVQADQKDIYADKLKQLEKTTTKMIKEAFALRDQKAQKIYRNWANQYDPKSDLVRVTDLDDQQWRNLIEYLVTNCEHFHFAASCDGIGHMIQCEGKAFRKWEAKTR